MTFLRGISGLVIIFVVIVIASFVLTFPFFQSGYFPTHDGEWAVVRLADMFRLIKEGQFPARYSGALNFGYGYPLFNFAYPFPYYLGLLIYFPLKSFVLSVKLMFVFSTLFSAILMYFASHELWKSRFGALVSAILYLYFPYRAVDLYVRGSLGESISFAIFPLIFFLSMRLFRNPFSRSVAVFLPIAIAALVGTHNIMTVLFLPTLTLFFVARVILEKRYEVLQTYILSLVLGAGLSAFFWLPALLEKGNVLLSQTPIADRALYFVSLSQLFVPSWGYAPPTEAGGFSYQLGVAQVTVMVVVLSMLVFSFLKRSPVGKGASLAVALVVIYIVYVLLLFPFTAAIWELTPLLNEINYPWTFLSQLGFITALLGGYICTVRYGKVLAGGLAVVAVVLVLPYIKPMEYVDRGEEFYITNEATTTSSDELLPLWVTDPPVQRFTEKVEVIEGDAVVENVTYRSNRIEFSYTATEDPTFRINTIYYPGWRAYLNHDPVEIGYDNPRGVMEVAASEHRDRVLLVFGETLPRTIANVISIVSVLFIGFISLRRLLTF